MLTAFGFRTVSPTVTVGAPRRRDVAGGSRIDALVGGRRVWFTSDDAKLAPAAEAFGSALLVPALRARRFLHAGDACAEWVSNLPALTAAFRGLWYPDAPGAAALPHAHVRPPAAGTALCFSGGADSFHTLLAGGQRVDTLVYAVGYDVKLRERHRAAMVDRAVRLVAAEMGIRPVVIRTNVKRHPLVRATPWLHAFGGAVAALGHLLRDDVGTLVMSSNGLASTPPDVSSRPETDPLFGSASLRIVHAAPTTTRLEKLRFLAGEPLAHRHLRVCWKNVGRDLNCGACEKCIRTMLALEACGGLERFSVFPKRGSLAVAVDALPPLEPVTAEFFRDVLGHGLPTAAAAAVRRLLDRSTPAPTATAPIATPSPRVVPGRGHRPRRLLPVAAFAHVFEPLVGMRVGYVRPIGNVGDQLIELAMMQLFGEFGVRWATWEPGASASFDALVFGGGGSMGIRYRMNHDLRSAALATGIPLTILPQSFTDAEDRPFARVYVRERHSLRRFRPDGVLAPDLALGLDWPAPAAATRDLGVFLRRDCERTGRKPSRLRDPARTCRTPAEYLALAASHRRIVTDRLHFAIGGLHAGRDVTLVANNYYKNQAMHETWLETLGCRFAETVADALAGSRSRMTRAA